MKKRPIYINATLLLGLVRGRGVLVKGRGYCGSGSDEAGNHLISGDIMLLRIPFLFVSAFAGVSCYSGACAAEQWAVFETSFTSGKKYNNPFTEVEVDVVFTQGAKQWKVPAFWASFRKNVPSPQDWVLVFEAIQ